MKSSRLMLVELFHNIKCKRKNQKKFFHNILREKKKFQKAEKSFPMSISYIKFSKFRCENEFCAQILIFDWVAILLSFMRCGKFRFHFNITEKMVWEKCGAPACKRK